MKLPKISDAEKSLMLHNDAPNDISQLLQHLSHDSKLKSITVNS